jgi:hypothetical protein
MPRKQQKDPKDPKDLPSLDVASLSDAELAAMGKGLYIAEGVLVLAINKFLRLHGEVEHQRDVAAAEWNRRHPARKTAKTVKTAKTARKQ